MIESGMDTYFRAQQVSPQWAAALPALADAMAGLAGERELNALFRSAGLSMGEDAARSLAGVETIADLESAVNEYWLARRWGWVAFEERKSSIGIVHHAAPLAEAFGEASLGWSCGLLEGFYEALLHALGAGEGLRVEAESCDSGGLVLRFRFGR